VNDIKSRVGALADRVRKTRAPSLESTPEHFKIQRWFDAVCEDRGRLQEAVDYFKTAIVDARPHMTAVGPLETLLAETPGLDHYYKGVLVDAQQIRRWLEEMHEIMTARKVKSLMYDRESRQMYGELNVTSATKLAKAEDDIARLAMEIRVIANVENHLLSVIEGFTTRNINLSRIVEIRKANLQDVWIDPTKGTSNV
jgi:hypothetical protein